MTSSYGKYSARPIDPDDRIAMRKGADEQSMGIPSVPALAYYVALFESAGTKELRSVYSIQH
jgi:hypothetical protein